MNGTGKVSNEAITKMLDSGKFDMSPTEMQQLLGQLAGDEEGFVDYTTWLAAIVDWKQVSHSPNL